MRFPETLNANEGTQFPTMAEMRKRVFELLAPRPYDTLITYAEFEAVLQLNPADDRRARSAVLKAARDLLQQQDKKLVNVRNEGYRIIRPNEHQNVSRHQQQRARRRLRDALETVTHIALDKLTPTEVAQVMLEQARVGIQLAITKRFARAKQLPPRNELHLPSAMKLVDMMRKKGA